MKNYYIEDGLLKFNALKNDKLKIVTTYDNKIWGNMNPYFAKSQEEKDKIAKNDNKLADLLETNTSFVLTTPPENTICNLNYAVYNQLTNINKVDEYINKFISLRTNSVIFSRKDKKTSFIIAPADCPIVVVTNKNRDFVTIMHMGFPQFTHELHRDTITLTKNHYDLNQEIDIYITPYICSKHYLIAKDKYQLALNVVGYKLEKYAKVIKSDIYNEDRISIDLKSLINDELLSLIPNSNIIDLNICTYELVTKGNMFSHKYVTDQKQLGNEVSEGNFNVVVNI